MLILHHRCFLDHAVSGSHEQIFVIVKFTHGDNGRNLLLRHQLKKVYNSRSPGCTSCLRYLICLQTVHASGIGKEHHIVMVGGHEKVLDIVLLNGLHALDSLAASVLAPEIIYIHTLDVAQMGHGNDGVLVRNQVLHGHIIVISNGCAAVIPIFIRDNHNFIPDNGKELLLIRKNCLQFLDLCLKFPVLILQLLTFQTSESTEPHIHDSL